jgi:hypothetical protein
MLDAVKLSGILWIAADSRERHPAAALRSFRCQNDMKLARQTQRSNIPRQHQQTVQTARPQLKEEEKVTRHTRARRCNHTKFAAHMSVEQAARFPRALRRSARASSNASLPRPTRECSSHADVVLK